MPGLRAGVAVLLLAGFAFGLVRLFDLRFRAGDIYPPYSSLRSDPLGTRAFYEGLAGLDAVSADRNFRPVVKALAEARDAVFFLGVRVGERAFADEDFLKAVNRAAFSGARIVISFYPEPWRRVSKKQKSLTQKVEIAALSRLWGLGFGYERIKTRRKETPAQPLRPDPLPASVSWRSSLYFADVSDAWRIIYVRNGLPVIVERSLGAGAVVLCSDSYFISNEGILKERHPELLAWLMGDKTAAVFDEWRHGIRKQANVAGLIRRYRIHGFLFGAALVLALFFWKRSAPLVPPREEAGTEDLDEAALKRDAAQGLISLLKRNVGDREIIGVCFREWEAAPVRNHPLAADQLERIQSVVIATRTGRSPDGDPVRAYRRISRILSENRPAQRKEL